MGYRNWRIKYRDLGGSSYHEVYRDDEPYGAIDLCHFRGIDQELLRKLEAVVLDRCIGFLTKDNRHHIQLRNFKKFTVLAEFSVEHIIRRIELEASSCCNVCMHRDGYCGCLSAEYGQNWSCDEIGECEGFRLESRPLQNKRCPEEFMAWVRINNIDIPSIATRFSEFHKADKYLVAANSREYCFEKLAYADDFAVSIRLRDLQGI